jgi:hypothetical protein
MISHFYVHITLAKTVDCRVIGWRTIGVNAVTIERITVDGHDISEEFKDDLLTYRTHIYRELERKLGFPPYSLSKQLKEQHHVDFQS